MTKAPSQKEKICLYIFTKIRVSVSDPTHEMKN